MMGGGKEKRNLPIMNLLGQLEKIEKHDESIAMPTARNYSPEEEN